MSCCKYFRSGGISSLTQDVFSITVHFPSRFLLSGRLWKTISEVTTFLSGKGLRCPELVTVVETGAAGCDSGGGPGRLPGRGGPRCGAAVSPGPAGGRARGVTASAGARRLITPRSGRVLVAGPGRRSRHRCGRRWQRTSTGRTHTKQGKPPDPHPVGPELPGDGNGPPWVCGGLLGAAGGGRGPPGPAGPPLRQEAAEGRAEMLPRGRTPACPVLSPPDDSPQDGVEAAPPSPRPGSPSLSGLPAASLLPRGRWGPLSRCPAALPPASTVRAGQQSLGWARGGPPAEEALPAGSPRSPWGEGAPGPASCEMGPDLDPRAAGTPGRGAPRRDGPGTIAPQDFLGP